MESDESAQEVDDAIIDGQLIVFDSLLQGDSLKLRTVLTPSKILAFLGDNLRGQPHIKIRLARAEMGSNNFNGCQSQNPHQFSIKTNQKTYLFVTDTQEVQQNWMFSIENCMKKIKEKELVTIRQKRSSIILSLSNKGSSISHQQSQPFSPELLKQKSMVLPLNRKIGSEVIHQEVSQLENGKIIPSKSSINQFVFQENQHEDESSVMDATRGIESSPSINACEEIIRLKDKISHMELMLIESDQKLQISLRNEETLSIKLGDQQRLVTGLKIELKKANQIKSENSEVGQEDIKVSQRDCLNKDEVNEEILQVKEVKRKEQENFGGIQKEVQRVPDFILDNNSKQKRPQIEEKRCQNRQNINQEVNNNVEIDFFEKSLHVHKSDNRQGSIQSPKLQAEIQMQSIFIVKNFWNELSGDFESRMQQINQIVRSTQTKEEKIKKYQKIQAELAQRFSYVKDLLNQEESDGSLSLSHILPQNINDSKGSLTVLEAKSKLELIKMVQKWKKKAQQFKREYQHLLNSVEMKRKGEQMGRKGEIKIIQHLDRNLLLKEESSSSFQINDSSCQIQGESSILPAHYSVQERKRPRQ